MNFRWAWLLLAMQFMTTGLFWAYLHVIGDAKAEAALWLLLPYPLLQTLAMLVLRGRLREVMSLPVYCLAPIISMLVVLAWIGPVGEGLVQAVSVLVAGTKVVMAALVLTMIHSSIRQGIRWLRRQPLQRPPRDRRS